MSRLFNARTLAILFQGFASGLPLALSGSTLQAWFAINNISIVTIGLLTLVGQPYVYKFLWAPLLDRFIPPFLGRRRGWIALMQVGLIITIICMALGNPKTHTLLLAMLALVLAFFSATQDIAIDAYRTDVLSPEERGIGAAFTMTGYRTAMVVSGGLALIMADHFGWQSTYLFMAALMLISVVITWMSPEPETSVAPTTMTAAIIEPWRTFKFPCSPLLIFLFIVLYKIGDAFTISLSTAFLIESLHFSLSVVGSINKVLGITASILGGIAGGVLLARLNIYRALWWFGIGQALCSFLYMGLAIVGKSVPLLAVTVSADAFFSGLSGVALIAFITSLCDKRFSASQYALLSAIASIGRVVVGPLAGLTVNSIGWVNFFLLSFFISIPGLWLLWYLRNSYDAQLSNEPA